MKKYRITKKWGKYKVGQILNDSLEVRRKLEEGGCLEEVKENYKPEKMETKPVKNKMESDDSKNKGAK